MRLIDGNLPIAHFLDLLGVDVDTHDLIARFCKTGSGDQPDITGTDNSNFHDKMAYRVSSKIGIDPSEDRVTHEFLLIWGQFCVHGQADDPIGQIVGDRQVSRGGGHIGEGILLVNRFGIINPKWDAFL